MRLFKSCTVAGQPYALASEDITLLTNCAGRAVLQVLAEAELKGEVTFALGWNTESDLTLFFTGDVVRSVRVDAKQQRLFCREVTARLDAPHPLALRHPTLNDVLAVYAARTQLAFILPDKPYARTRVSAFYGLGSGLHGLNSIGGVFGIDDYFWQTQGDGKVFVGAWADSRWQKRPIDVPPEFFCNQSATGSQTLTAVPALRPGAMVNGQRVTSLRLSGHQMTLGLAHA